MTGARSVGEMSSRGSRFGAAFGHFNWNASLTEGREIIAVRDVIAEVVAHGTRLRTG